MVRILAVSDEVVEQLDGKAVRALRPDVVAGCGDVPFERLGELAEAADAPLVFVPGNHDPDLSGYRGTRSGLVVRAGLPTTPPWPPGALNADGRLVDAGGLRFGGLGGSLRYRSGPNQYTERQQGRRARRLVARARWRRLWDGRRVDVVLTHAPVRALGDDDDPVHEGFAAFAALASALQPELLLHGHVQPQFGDRREHRLGTTRVLNVFDHLMVEAG
ncbi:MAG: metallophosphoesterase [Acidimicrobiaceae bacterium]|nr:metallophosphoesterase [Acidimicrobiaceae bacterium]